MKLFHVEIRRPDALKTLSGLAHILDGIVRTVTIGMVTIGLSSSVSWRILRRDVNRSRAERGLPPYTPFNRDHGRS